jgi:hypothetical protein
MRAKASSLSSEKRGQSAEKAQQAPHAWQGDVMRALPKRKRQGGSPEPALPPISSAYATGSAQAASIVETAVLPERLSTAVS